MCRASDLALNHVFVGSQKVTAEGNVHVHNLVACTIRKQASKSLFGGFPKLRVPFRGSL